MVHRVHGNRHHNAIIDELPLAQLLAAESGVLLLGTRLRFEIAPYVTDIHEILNIVIFSVFLFWFILRYTWYPSLIKITLEDFSQSNYLGAIPIAFDTLIVGIATFYSDRPGAMRVGYAFWWINAFVTIAVSMGAVFIMFVKQPQHKLDDVTGV